MTIIFNNKRIAVDTSDKRFIKMGFKKLRFGDRVIIPRCNYAIILLGFGIKPPDKDIERWWKAEFAIWPCGRALWYKRSDGSVNYFYPVSNEQDFQRV